MNDSKQENGERLSRQQAAERLTDVAYALTIGGEVVLKRNGSADGDRVALELELSWSTAKPET